MYSTPQDPSSQAAIAGPARYDRNAAQPPTFRVWPGGHSHYAVEVTTDPALFGADRAAARNDANFFASWTGGLLAAAAPTVFELPPQHWRQLRSAATLYYRVVTSADGAGWRDARSSFTPGQPTPAPALLLYGQLQALPAVPRKLAEARWHQA